MNFKKLMELEYKRYLSNKILFIIMFILPIFTIITVVGAINYLSGSNLYNSTIAIVDCDGGEDMNMFMGILKNTNSISENAELIDKDYETAMNELEADKIDIVVVIPEKFTSDIYHGRETYLEIIHKQSSVDSVKTKVFKKVAIDGVNLGIIAQENLDEVRKILKEEGYSSKEIRENYNDNITKLLLNIMSRNKIFEIEEYNTSIMYFIALFFVIFVFLNGLIVFVISNDENNINILNRLKINNINYNDYILCKFIISTILQVVLYGVPVGIACIMINNFSVKLVVAIVVICIFANLIIYVLSKITKNKIITVGIVLAIVIIGGSGVGKFELNIIEECTYALINIFNNRSMDKLSILSVASCIMFIFNFNINFKKISNKEM